jgi:SAM-dependent methyltransferase
MSNSYQCRICGSNNTEYFGVLQKQQHFAGKLPNQNLPESGLYKCNDCLLLTRHPILTVSEYNNLYAQASSTVWSTSDVNLRPDQIIAKNIILEAKGTCKILDVGCYTGDLLSALPNNYIKYGIEMSKEASIISTTRGINMIGNDLYHINTNDKFNLIVAIDVIEHTQNPEAFLNKLSTMLEAEGSIIISTGNSDSWLWKYLKNRFWYSKYPEHISFIGVNWLDRFCKNNNYTLTKRCFFNYSPINIQLSLKAIIKLALSLMRINPERFSNITKDHFCFVIKNKYL